MCGIVGYIGKKECTGILLDALSKLEYRGYDSAGIAVFDKDDKTIKTVKAKGRLKDLEKKMNGEGRLCGLCGIGHTRWATHGEPSDINSHPHGNARVTIVHNGIIENYKKIKEFLESKGYVFESQTDTETVAKLLDYYYDGKNPMDCIKNVINQIEGSYALGILFKDYPDRIYAIRKDSPLIVGRGENESFIASDVPAILKYTKDYYLLDEDEIAVLDTSGERFYTKFGEQIKKELLTADFDEESAAKGGFEHFMLKEIHEQPNAIKMTVTPRISNGMPDFSECGLTDEMLSGYKRIFVIACGTAMHAGTVGKYVIERLARVPVTVDLASEFRYRNPILNKEDLVILVSQSGETADTLAALRLAKNVGAATMSIVNVKGSSIARESDIVVYTHAGPEISVASTKAYMVQIAVFYLLAFKLAYIRNTISKDECKRLVSVMLKVPSIIESVLELSDTCSYVASKLVNSENLLYIGRGLDYALSMEGSLKLKEISYIHSEAYAAGELKHGTISLVTEQMPVIAVATQRELFDKTVSNVKEVKARGAKVILITHKCMSVDEEAADYVIKLPTIDDMLMPMIGVVPLQLIAYYASVLRGNDVDKPRNLAKSVTVE